MHAPPCIFGIKIKRSRLSREEGQAYEEITIRRGARGPYLIKEGDGRDQPTQGRDNFSRDTNDPREEGLEEERNWANLSG